MQRPFVSPLCSDRVGYFEDGKFVDVTPEWSAYAEIVGRNGALFDW
jgi:hypothetical protein